MSEAQPSPTWSIVTFTADEAALGELAALQARFSDMRFCAVVPRHFVAPGQLNLLVDQDGRLAESLAVSGTRTYVMDGRGTVAHSWDGVPEAEAIAVYSARPPLPSGAPAWLFPVLAAVVLLAAIGAWVSTHAPAAAPVVLPPAPVAAVEAPPAEVAPAEVPAEAPVAEAADPADAADPGEADAPAGGKGPGGRVRGARNIVGGWQIAPRDQAPNVASVAGDEFTLKALADKVVVACREPMPLTGPTTFSAEWKLAGLTGKPAKIDVRQLGADGKPIREAGAHGMLGRGKATTGWQSLSVDLKPVAGAKTAKVCVQLDMGAGTAMVRKVKP